MCLPEVEQYAKNQINVSYHASLHDNVIANPDVERKAGEGSWLRWFFNFIWWIRPLLIIDSVIYVIITNLPPR